MKPAQPPSLRKQAEKSLFAVFKWTALFFAIFMALLTAGIFELLKASAQEPAGNCLVREMASRAGRDPDFALFLLTEAGILLAGLILLIIMFFAARYFSSYISQPIVASLSSLEKQMRALADNHPDSQVPDGVPVEAEVEEIQDLARAANAVISKLKAIGMQDSLTGIHNRSYFEAQMQRLSAEDSGAGLGIIMCDLDNLKVTNDTLGHKAGDYLLCKAAMVLRTVVRDEDIVARIGGDEFVIILHGCSDDDVQQVMKRVRDNISRFNDSSSLRLGLSMGYGYGRLGLHAVDDILAEADSQMYMDKGAMIQGMLPLVNGLLEDRRESVARENSNESLAEEPDKPGLSRVVSGY